MVSHNGKKRSSDFYVLLKKIQRLYFWSISMFFYIVGIFVVNSLHDSTVLKDKCIASMGLKVYF